MLKEIIKNKKKEVETSRKNLPLDSFKARLKNSKRDFKAALSKNGLALIAEFKRTSPSKNIKEKDFDMRKIIGIYNKYASAISVLTDKKFFNGSLTDLEEVSELTNLPLLRKDFIIDEYQIYESRMHNADAILLIVSMLSDNQINKFIEIAKKYDMGCIVEVHTEEELSRALNCNAEIIGINNRNLDTLKIDTETTLKLAKKIPKNKIIISESGISSRDYVEKIKNTVNAILVGSHFMNSENVEKEIIALIK
ncbi:MAG: indole-3-glycerol phosphate synthase TrpC [Nanoarchaeota archaeon]